MKVPPKRIALMILALVASVSFSTVVVGDYSITGFFIWSGCILGGLLIIFAVVKITKRK